MQKGLCQVAIATNHKGRFLLLSSRSKALHLLVNAMLDYFVKSMRCCLSPCLWTSHSKLVLMLHWVGVDACSLSSLALVLLSFQSCCVLLCFRDRIPFIPTGNTAESLSTGNEGDENVLCIRNCCNCGAAAAWLRLDLRYKRSIDPSMISEWVSEGPLVDLDSRGSLERIDGVDVGDFRNATASSGVRTSYTSQDDNFAQVQDTLTLETSFNLGYVSGVMHTIRLKDGHFKRLSNVRP